MSQVFPQQTICMNSGKYNLFKLSVLVTPYDKHLNPEKHLWFSEHSETITCSKYASKSIVTEEWQNFYTRANSEVNAYISTKTVKFVLKTANKEVTILNLCLAAVPNIRCQTKDRTLQIKYYVDWENKFQLNFYTQDEMQSCKILLDNALSKLFGDMRFFVGQMEDLTGKVDEGLLKADDNLESYEAIKKKFSKLVNKENDM